MYKQHVSIDALFVCTHFNDRSSKGDMIVMNSKVSFRNMYTEILLYTDTMYHMTKESGNVN